MAKTKSKRTPPRRRPATQQDVERAKREATEFAATYVWAVMFSTLRDKFGWGPVRLMRLWTDVLSLADSITEGYVKIDDLVHTLKEESGITLADLSIESAKKK